MAERLNGIFCMKLEQIIPEYPFLDYTKGYVSYNREGRKIIQLYNRMKRRTISFARYRVSVLLKRELKEDEEVDHIDNNNRNDSDENLQVLTRAENLLKQSKVQKVPMIIFRCKECGKDHSALPSEYRSRVKAVSGSDLFCSKRCASKHAIKTKKSPSIELLMKNSVPLHELCKILELKNKNKSLREIACEIGKSNQTVHYHLKRMAKSIGDENGLENRRGRNTL